MNFYQMYRKMTVVVTLFVGWSCTEVRTIEVHEHQKVSMVQEVFSRVQTVTIELPSPSFEMGNDLLIDEKPVHSVVLTQPIESMQSEVTQELYISVMDENPSFFRLCGLDCPVEKVRWLDVIHFSNRLNELLNLEQCYVVGTHGKVEWTKGLQCSGWRLPTEAEWEWMATPSDTNKYLLLHEVAWFKGNSNHRTHPVCQKELNGHQLCDILGNVQEWVWDVVAPYPIEEVINPLGGLVGSHHVFRGGAWNRYSENVVSTKRKDGAYLFRNNDLGFRLVRSIDSEE